MTAENSIGPLGESPVLQAYASAMSSGFTSKRLKKNELLCREGEPCQYFSLVVSGILCHYVTTDADEKTTYLALKNSFTTALESFLTGKPSRKSIVAIVPTELLCIDRESFSALMTRDETFRSAYFELIQKQICLIDDYRIDLLTLTPEERYQKLLQTEPVLLQQVPLRLLASFLGISVRHMSRIRQNTK